MKKLLTLHLALSVAAMGAVACGTDSDEVATLPQDLVASIDKGDGTRLEIYEVHDEGILIDYYAEDSELDLPALLPEYENLTPIGLFEALSGESAPVSLRDAQARLAENLAADGVLVPEQPGQTPQISTGRSSLSAEAFRQLTCRSIFPDNRQTCMISRSSGGADINIRTANGERIDFAAQPNGTGSALVMELRQSTFLGTAYARIGTNLRIFNGNTLRRIFVRNGRRNLRARIINQEDVRTFHAFATITQIPGNVTQGDTFNFIR